MRVAALQFDVRRGDVAANLEAAARGLRAAAADGVELVCLPEMWPTSFVADREGGEGRDWLASTEEALAEARRLSGELGLVVAGTSFGKGEEGEALRNRMTVYDRGEEVYAYDKVHLFSPTGEPLGFSAGKSAPPTVSIRGMKVAGITCYDLRFSALLRAPFEAGAEVLLVAAQWPAPRARHWRAMVLGRAVEHQSFVIASNRCGTDVFGRRAIELAFPGNSLVASPNGEVLAEGAGDEGLVACDIDLEDVHEIRRRVPVREDARPALHDDWRG